MGDTELNLETLTKVAHSTAEEEDAKMQKINNLLKMIEAQVSMFSFIEIPFGKKISLLNLFSECSFLNQILRNRVILHFIDDHI